MIPRRSPSAVFVFGFFFSLLLGGQGFPLTPPPTTSESNSTQNTSLTNLSELLNSPELVIFVEMALTDDLPTRKKIRFYQELLTERWADRITLTHSTGGRRNYLDPIEVTQQLIEKYNFSPRQLTLHFAFRDLTPSEIDTRLRRMTELGIDSVLVLTGDPRDPNEIIGEPDSKVYEYPTQTLERLGSIKGVKLIPLVAANAAADSMGRLNEKRISGASVAITQPILDLEEFEKFMDAFRRQSWAPEMKLIIGVIPIHSYRQLEWMKDRLKLKVSDLHLQRMKQAELKDLEPATLLSEELVRRISLLAMDHGNPIMIAKEYAVRQGVIDAFRSLEVAPLKNPESVESQWRELLEKNPYLVQRLFSIVSQFDLPIHRADVDPEGPLPEMENNVKQLQNQIKEWIQLQMIYHGIQGEKISDETFSHQQQEGEKITVEILEKIRQTPGVSGIDLMPIHYYARVVELLQKAGYGIRTPTRERQIERPLKLRWEPQETKPPEPAADSHQKKRQKTLKEILDANSETLSSDGNYTIEKLKKNYLIHHWNQTLHNLKLLTERERLPSLKGIDSSPRTRVFRVSAIGQILLELPVDSEVLHRHKDLTATYLAAQIYNTLLIRGVSLEKIQLEWHQATDAETSLLWDIGNHLLPVYASGVEHHKLLVTYPNGERALSERYPDPDFIQRTMNQIKSESSAKETLFLHLSEQSNVAWIHEEMNSSVPTPLGHILLEFQSAQSRDSIHSSCRCHLNCARSQLSRQALFHLLRETGLGSIQSLKDLTRWTHFGTSQERLKAQQGWDILGKRIAEFLKTLEPFIAARRVIISGDLLESDIDFPLSPGQLLGMAIQEALDKYHSQGEWDIRLVSSIPTRRNNEDKLELFKQRHRKEFDVKMTPAVLEQNNIHPFLELLEDPQILSAIQEVKKTKPRLRLSFDWTRQKRLFLDGVSTREFGDLQEILIHLRSFEYQEKFSRQSLAELKIALLGALGDLCGRNATQSVKGYTTKKDRQQFSLESFTLIDQSLLWKLSQYNWSRGTEKVFLEGRQGSADEKLVEKETYQLFQKLVQLHESGNLDSIHRIMGMEIGVGTGKHAGMALRYLEKFEKEYNKITAASPHPIRIMERLLFIFADITSIEELKRVAVGEKLNKKEDPDERKILGKYYKNKQIAPAHLDAFNLEEKTHLEIHYQDGQKEMLPLQSNLSFVMFHFGYSASPFKVVQYRKNEGKLYEEQIMTYLSLHLIQELRVAYGTEGFIRILKNLRKEDFQAIATEGMTENFWSQVWEGIRYAENYIEVKEILDQYGTHYQEIVKKTLQNHPELRVPLNIAMYQSILKILKWLDPSLHGTFFVMDIIETDIETYGREFRWPAKYGNNLATWPNWPLLKVMLESVNNTNVNYIPQAVKATELLGESISTRSKTTTLLEISAFWKNSDEGIGQSL